MCLTCEILYFLLSEPLIDTPRQGSFYLKRALLAPVCQSPPFASFLPLPSKRISSLLAVSDTDYGSFGSCRRPVGCTYSGAEYGLYSNHVPNVVPVWCLCGAYCGCGCEWVVWVLTRRQEQWSAGGVGNLYTWRSRRGVRESMICRYDGPAQRKKKLLVKSFGALKDD